MIYPLDLTLNPDDGLNFESDQNIKKHFVNDEIILLSCPLTKINKKERCQERAILITSKAIYNINKFEKIANAISLVVKDFPMRRRINIEKLSAITLSENSLEFVIHVKGEFDYRYSSSRRKEVISAILKSHIKPVPFFYKASKSLHEFTTTDDDVKAGIVRTPTDIPILMDEEAFTKRVDWYDFELLDVLRRRPSRVVKKDTNKIYGIRIVNKEENLAKAPQACFEYVLENNKSPFVETAEYSFEVPKKRVFITKPMKGGELATHLHLSDQFDEERAKFYAAELILGLEYLHDKLGVLYRNFDFHDILMDEEGHICLSNFELSKRLDPEQLTYSLCGTAEYISPEIIQRTGHEFSSDWWALGAAVYEMLIGLPPFYTQDLSTTRSLRDRQEKDLTFQPEHDLSDDAKDFIQQLLQKNPEERLGSKGADQIKKHKWLESIDWDLLSEHKVVPPFKPEVDQKWCDERL